MNDQTEEIVLLDKEQQPKPAFLVHGNRLAIAFWCLSDLYRCLQTQFKVLLAQNDSKCWWDDDGASQNILKYSHAVLCLSADYCTAWNCRRTYLTHQNVVDFPMIKKELAGMARVLSKYPKSGECWAYRYVPSVAICSVGIHAITIANGCLVHTHNFLQMVMRISNAKLMFAGNGSSVTQKTTTLGPIKFYFINEFNHQSRH